MVTTPTVIYAFDPISGIDRFVFSQQNCVIHGAVLGSAGALISQTCVKPNCDGKSFCGSGPQLLLRDGQTRATTATARIRTASSGTRSVTPTCRRQLTSWCPRWTRPPGSCSVSTLRRANPCRRSRCRAPPARPASTRWRRRARTSSFRRHHLRDRPDALRRDLARRVAQLPTVTAPSGDASAVPVLATAIVAAATAQGVDLLDGETGRVTRTVAMPTVAIGSTAYPLGSGFVLSGSSTEVYR